MFSVEFYFDLPEKYLNELLRVHELVISKNTAMLSKNVKIMKSSDLIANLDQYFELLFAQNYALAKNG